MTIQSAFNFQPLPKTEPPVADPVSAGPVVEQSQAALETRVRADRRNLVIEAGAGTGKTTAIVGEVLKLMLEDAELSPERIVLVTFTEKAAGEIADRIREALAELDAHFDDERVVWPIGSPNPIVEVPADRKDEWRRACAIQLERLDGLRSQTIHSFCQSLLRTFPIEAGLDPQFKIIEGFERSLLYGQLYDAWLDRETRLVPKPEALVEWEYLFEHVGYLFQIRDLVFALLNRRDLLHETGYDLGAFDLVEPSLREAVQVVRDAPLDRISDYFRSEPVPADGATLHDWIAYINPIAAEIRRASLPRGKKNETLNEAIKLLRAGDKGDCIVDSLISHRSALALMALTKRFIDFLDAEKRKLGVVDFDDLLLRTLDVLGDAAVLERARSQFDYIFVDEFQDTDRTQAKIIDLLARDRDGAYVSGKTIVVGDPKQSIYGFRRADPETYHRMTEELVAGGADRDRLQANYRSDAPLLEAINAIFGCLFPESGHDPNVFRPAYHPLEAGKKKPARDVDARITMLHAMHDEKSDRHFAEAEAIAEWITQHRDRDGDDLRRYAILFRRLTKVDDYLDTLERYDIECVLPPTRMFLDRPAPVDLLAVLRAIAYPFDRGAEISAARTAYFALTDEEIVTGFETPQRSNDAPPIQHSTFNIQHSTLTEHPVESFKTTLARYREESKHLTVSQTIDLLVTTSGIEEVYAAAADGARHKRHLEHVRAIAFEYDEKIGGSVRQFVDEIDRRRAEPDELEPSLADESKNAVRILTVHAAKGLEFDTVIMPDLAFATNAADAVSLFTTEEPRALVMAGRAESISGNFRYVGDQKLKKVASQREEAELKRLFYVAVTRAKAELVFVCNLGEETRHVGFFKCVGEVLTMKKDDLGVLFPSTGREVRPLPIGSTIVPIAFERLDVRDTSARDRHRLNDHQLETALAHGALVTPELPAPAETPSLTPADVAGWRSAARHRVAGILLHRVLELWDGTTDPETLLRRLAIEQAANNDSVTWVRLALPVVKRSPTFARIRAAETLGRELPVHIADASGNIIERRIDRLIRERHRDIVIDYKSGHADEARKARGQEQVARYCEAISAITGRPCEGLLWYIDADGDETVAIRA